MAAHALNVVPLPDRDIWERDRLAALQKFDVLDTPREEAFDRITRLIRNIFDIEIGIVSMIDAHRQWYKSVEGLATIEAARSETFCRFPLLSGQPVVVEDAMGVESVTLTESASDEPVGPPRNRSATEIIHPNHDK